MKNLTKITIYFFCKNKDKLVKDFSKNHLRRKKTLIIYIKILIDKVNIVINIFLINNDNIIFKFF